MDQHCAYNLCFCAAMAERSSSDSSITPPPRRKRTVYTRRHTKRKKLPHGTSHAADGKNNVTDFYSVFRKHYKSLLAIIQSCPDSLAGKLFSSRLLSSEVVDQIITGHDSSGTKASRIVHAVCNRVKADPEKLLDFVEVLEEEPSFDDLVREIHGKLNSIFCVNDLHSVYSYCPN